METRTYTTLFNIADVDMCMGALYKSLETDYLKRKEHMSTINQRACEARLAVLRGTWMLLLDRSQD